jgi:hypothetical protein
MRKTMIAAVCLILLTTASARPPKQTPQAGPPAKALEAKIRKAWEDFKTKNKDAFAAILADGFTEAEEDGTGFRDAKTEVAEIDQFDLDKYTLTDFKVRPIGSDGALVTYMAEYSGKAAGQPVSEKDALGEVWVRHGNDWKLLHVQETKVK